MDWHLGRHRYLSLFACVSAACILSLFTLPPGAAGAAAVPQEETGFQASAMPYWAWYLPEGCTIGMETWVLVQNPNPNPAVVDLTLMTDTGMVSPPALQGVTLPAWTRASFPIHAYVATYDVSTFVGVTSGDGVCCERAVYGPGRQWATGSTGSTLTSTGWFLAEGSTAGGMETWVLVQNPYPSDTTVSLTLMTDGGELKPPGLQNVVLPPRSRKSFNLGDYVTTYNVSTMVQALNNGVVCERAMYGPGRQWATASVGATNSAADWYMAEGCTAGGMETWVLVQNPHPTSVDINMEFYTDTGSVFPGNIISIPAYSRASFNLADQMAGYYHLGTRVHALNGTVVCERAMYGPGREWATDSIGAGQLKNEWYLAEGCTRGMETWVLIMNAGPGTDYYTVFFVTEAGMVQPPELQFVMIDPGCRVSINAGQYVTGYDVSTVVTSTANDLSVERSMYGPGRKWATNSVGVPGI
jgi:hypothetical protein